MKRLAARFVADSLYAKLAFLKSHGRLPRTPPVIFNEFLCELKSTGELYRYQCFADKIVARTRVADRVGQRYLVPLYGTAKRLTREFWDELPDSFIIKANHGSSWNRIVWNKVDEDFSAIARQTDGWLKKNFYYVRREQQYRHIEPALIFEKLLVDDEQDALEEYKLFCFHGKVGYILAIRSNDEYARGCYDHDWNRLDVMNVPPNQVEIPRPECLDEVIGVAEVLARDFTFVRVDLYVAGREVYFGELTFVPGGGGSVFRPESFGEALGRLWAGKNADLAPFIANPKIASPQRAASRATR